MVVLTLTTYWDKSWLIKNWLLTVPMKKLQTKFKENELLKKKYFILKTKSDKGIDLTFSEKSIKLRFNDIIW